MLSKIKKKKKAEKEEAFFKDKAAEEVKKNRQFGDYIFDYFKACTHSHATNCALCKLVTISVRDHFVNEGQQKALAKIESKKRRAHMRFNILDNWSKNQSNFVEELLVGFTMDVNISGSFVKALSALRKYGVKGNLQFDSMIKLMERKRRILEVGYFAAVFIQSRVRKFIARIKFRRELLRRFEYAPKTAYRDEFYLDTKWFRKQNSYPPLLRRLQERPNTPNTIGRRIKHEEKLAAERFERYNEAMKAFYAPLVEEDEDPKKINIWELEDKIIYSYRQLAIVRDLIEIMTQTLSAQVIAKGSKVANALLALNKKGDSNVAFSETSSTLSVFKFLEREKEMQRIEDEKKKAEEEASNLTSGAVQLNSKQIADALAATLAAARPVPRKLPFPCFLSFTAPAPCSRQLGLAVIVAKDCPYNDLKEENKTNATTNVIAANGRAPPGGKTGGGRANSPAKSPGRPRTGSKDKDKDKKKGEKGKDGEDSKLEEDDEEDETNQVDYNKRLRELEQKAWDAMICVHTTDVLNKLMSEDNEPVLASAVNFAMDDFGIWNGRRDMPKPSDRANKAYHIPSPVKEKKKTKEEGDNEEAKPEGEEGKEKELPDLCTDVLPFSFQLRPYTEFRGPHCLFRLFFFEGELLAISQASQFAFYNEILQAKDSILRAIRSFASNSSIKSLIRVYSQKANPNASTNSSSSSSSYSMLPPIRTTAEDNVNGGQVSFFLPGENLLFNRMDHPLDMVGAIQNISKATIDPDQTIDYENFYYSKSDMQKIRAFNYLPDKKVIEIDRKYKFFSKITSWKDRVKRAVANDRNAKRAEMAAKEEEKKKQKELEEYRRSVGKKDDEVKVDPNSRQGIFSNTKFIGETFIEYYGLNPVVADTFRKNFEQYSTKTHTSIRDRMVWKEAEPVPEVRYDLIAIDVMVNLKHSRDITPDFADIFKKHDEMIKAADKLAAAEKAAKLAARGGKPTKEGESEPADRDPITVSLHQIVGIFSTENEKGPPNVDFGLYNWDTFLAFRQKKNAGLPISEFNRPPATQNWSPPNPSSGISVIRSQNQSSGNEFSMKILGDKPSRDYLSAELPKKVKVWIGMP